MPFTGLVYAPMLELIDLLRAHGFRVFIVTGGGVDFVRAVGAQLYGVAARRRRRLGAAGRASSAATGAWCSSARPSSRARRTRARRRSINIHAHIGRRPIVAVGNSAGDREMLEYAHTGDAPSLCLVVDHDDEEREYAYAGEAVTNPDAEPIADTAARLGWTVVSMRHDWSRVFAVSERRGSARRDVPDGLRRRTTPRRRPRTR